MHTVAKDVTGKRDDFVTLRHIDAQGHLIQTAINGPAQFERVFTRK